MYVNCFNKIGYLALTMSILIKTILMHNLASIKAIGSI